MTTVVNKHKDRYDTYIGRGSVYGNPFIISKDNTREAVLLNFTKYFYDKVDKDPEFKKQVLLLKDCRLGCFCKPEACHGDIIAEYVNNYWTKVEAVVS